MPKSTYKFGIFAEYICVIILFFKGYRIIENRYKTKFGEIDIIASRFNSLVFIEVKARKDKNLKEVLTINQMNRIVGASKLFLTKNSKYFDHNIRFDLIIFHSPIKMKHIKNAWEGSL